MMDERKQTLKKRALTGGFALSGKRIILQFISTGANIILARLILPAEFGMFATATFVVTLFAVFSDLGLSPALIQKEGNLEEIDTVTAFTFQLLLGGLIIFIIWWMSPWLAHFYNLGKSGVNIFRFYGFIFLALPFKTVAGALLERQLIYPKLVLVEMLEALTIAGTTVSLAALGFGIWSLVIGAVLGPWVSAIAYFVISPWKIRLSINFTHFVKLARFGIPFQSQVILGLFFGPLIFLYMGKVVGSEKLGYYQFAAGVAALPLAISEIVNRVVFPLIARTHDKTIKSKIVSETFSLVAATTLPLVVGIMVLAPAIIRFVYGERWLPALPILYICVIQTGIVTFTGLAAKILLSLGQVKAVRNMTLLWAILTWVITPPLIHTFDFVGMSLSALVVAITGGWLIFHLRREIPFSLIHTLPFGISALLEAIVVLVIHSLLPQSLVTLMVTVFVGALAYGVSVWLTGAWKQLASLRLLRAGA